MSQQIGIDVGATNLRIGVVQNLKVIYEQSIHSAFDRNLSHLINTLHTQVLDGIIRNTINEFIMKGRY